MPACRCGNPATLVVWRFQNTSQFDLRELCNDADNIAKNFNAYVAGFSGNVKDILNELEIEKHIEKMDKDGCLFSVLTAPHR